MEWLLLLAAGLAAGFISGLLGVGGGIVITPVLHYLLKMSWAEAVALSLLVIAVQSPIGVWRHRRRGAVDLRVGIPLAVGGLAGVLLGAWLLPQTSVAWLKILFAALMAFAAWRLVARGLPRPDGSHLAWPILLGVGFVAGIVSRLLGVGGGILTVPLLVLLGVPAHLAVGTSLFSVFTNAAFASVLNLIAGLDWQGGLLLAVGAVLATPLGVRAAHALPERGLRRVIAAALAMVAVAIAVTSGVV